jgi:hypothetical protein
MLKLKWLIVLVLLAFVAQPCFADDRAKIVGTWKIVSQEWEIQATGERQPGMGNNPTVYIIFTPEGRMMALITGEGRNPPKTDQDRANLLTSMAAYTGMYSLEGDKLIYKAEVAWHPARVGTEQVRFCKFDGARLHITSDWMPSTGVSGQMGRTIITWERAK